MGCISMGVLLSLSIFWIVYGCVGLFGFQIIPNKYKGFDWTKSYIRFRGASWLMLGVPFLALFLAARNFEMNAVIVMLLMVILALPSIIYSFVFERKYKARLKEK